MRTLRIVLACIGALTGIAGVVLASPRLIAVSTVVLVGAILSAVRERIGRPEPGAPTSAEPGTPAPSADQGSEPSAEGQHGRGDGRSAVSPPAPAPVLRAAPPTAEPAELVAALYEAASALEAAAVGAHLWFEDTATSTVRLISAAGRRCPERRPVALEGSELGRAVLSGRAVWGHASIGSCGGPATSLRRYAVPLLTPVVRGVVAVDLAAERVDEEALTRLMAEFRGPLTGALALYVARQEMRSARTLLDACGKLVRLTDEGTIADALLRAAIDASGADTGSVMLLGPDGRLAVRAVVGLPETVLASPPLAPGEGIAGWVFAMERPLLIEDLDGRGPRGRRHGVRSALCVPIADEEGRFGVMNVGYRTFVAQPTAVLRRSLEIIALIGARTLRSANALVSSRELCFDALKALALALETKDPYAHGGTQRVLDLAVRLGTELGLGDKELESLKVAALLHDVGMSTASGPVGGQGGTLSTIEWGLVKAHPAIAADILQQVPALRDAVPIVYHHHERYDGGGYVVGLKGENIPLGARILAVADAFVAMTSDRPYRSAMSVDDALAEVRSGAGKQFDPAVAAALERVVRKTAAAREPGGSG